MNLWRKNRWCSSEQYAHSRCAAEADKRAAFWGRFLAFVCLIFLPAPAWSQDSSDKVTSFDIPQQRADEALIQFAEQAGLTFFVPFDQIEGVITNELTGSFPPEEAMDILLSGTGLQAEISDQGRLSILGNVASGGESDMNTRNRLSAGVLGSFLGLFGIEVLAQPENQDTSVSRYAIEEIIVSSRRVEEGLQNAPLAVTALTAADLENRGALDVVDFADIAPNVSLKKDGTTSGFGAAPRISIRGVGQADFVINTDPAVGMYADGVYLGRSLGSVMDLVDVERVEALRGPQGTLFGRNSTGGAINIISKKPDIGGPANGYLSAGIGEGGFSLLRGSVNVPLGDNSAARFTALKRERDGYIPALQYNNLDLGEEDVSGFRAAFRWQPNDSFTFDLDADNSSRSDTAAPFVPVVIGDLSIGETDLDASGAGGQASGISTSLFARRFNREAPTGPPINPNVVPFTSADPLCGTDQAYRDSSLTCLGSAWESSRDGSNQAWFDGEGNMVRPDDQSLDTYGYSARLTWDTDAFTLRSITAWRGFNSSFLNGGPAPIYTGTNDNEKFDQDQFSQEITINGSINENVRWLAGVFYQEEEGVEVVRTVFPLAPPSGNNDVAFLPTAGIEDRNIDNSSQAIFGQLSIDLSDTLELTVGARQTEEEKDVLINKIENSEGVISTVLEGSKSIEEPNFLVNLSYDMSEDVMLYGLFSDGFRNGGYPARTPPGTGLAFEEVQYEPEFVETFEFGAKLTALDGRLRANLAVFKSDYTDMQINASAFDPLQGGNVVTIQNLGESEISGFELEANYLVNDNFRLDASLGYLDATLASITAENGEFILNQNTNLHKIITSDDNIQLPHAPELQLNVGANYSFYLVGGAEIRNRVDFFYESEQHGTIGNYNLDKIDATTKVNYVLTYVPADAPWELAVGARNLTDAEDVLNANVNTGPGAAVYNIFSRGREAYLQFRYSFGD